MSREQQHQPPPPPKELIANSPRTNREGGELEEQLLWPIF